MLKIDIQQVIRMAAEGKQILRGLQNNETNEIDLLVRESIQNSLDAGFKNEDILIDYTINTFLRDELLDQLEGTEKLKNSIIDNENTFLMISDLNTIGLDGPISHEMRTSSDESTNLLKLVYDFGKAQSKSGAGGSWGYGKSIYYRIGNGLVFYYTRVKTKSGDYEERLVGCFVEDHTKSETLIDYNERNKTGIVWWGEYIDGIKSSVPIRNSSKIRAFLETFNVQPYKNTETGTKIIIPFINESEIMDSIKAGPSSMQDNYYDNVSEYIEYSVQRWYAPRINNKKYIYGNKNNLLVSINNELIDQDSQVKYFDIIREMYNYAINEKEDNILKVLKETKMNRKEIKISSHKKDGLSNDKLGTFVYAMFKYDELDIQNMTDSINPTFLSNLNKGETVREANVNRPIVLFTRQPGMVVNYVNKGEWLQGVSESPLEEYIVGLFVLNSNDNTYFETNYGNKTLEEYIRMNEKSDHIEWFDSNFLDLNGHKIEPKIVSKLKSNISRTLHNDYFKVKDESRSSTDVSGFISSLFGKEIMPVGLSNAPSEIKRSSNKKERSKSHKAHNLKNSITEIDYGNIKYESNLVKVPFKISTLKDFKGYYTIELKIDTVNGPIKISEFEEDITVQSPIFIEDIILGDANLNVKNHTTIDKNTKYMVSIDTGFSKIEVDELITGSVIIYTTDKSIAPFIEIKEVLKYE